MDQLAGFAKQFTGGNTQNQQQEYGANQAEGYSNEYQGRGQGQQSNSSGGGFMGEFGGNQEQRQGQGQYQQQQSNSGGGFMSELSGGQGQGRQQQSGSGGGFMSELSGNQGQGQQQSSSGGGGFLGGLGDKFNSAAGGGRESEKNEDYLDKGVDFVQERFLGQGPQDNESAIEQAKDEQISDFIRGKYKSTTGGDFPIQDKPTRFG